MLMCALLLPIAHETAGAARIRHSLRPLFSKGEEFPANLGRIVPRERRGVFCRHCEPPGRAKARPMTGSAKQSILPLRGEMDCFVASLLAMTALHDKAEFKCSTNQETHAGVARRISAHSPVMRAIGCS